MTYESLPARLARCPAMNIGVPVAGLLPATFGHHAVSDSALAHQTFIYTWMCMALVILLSALVFWRVPDDISKNVTLTRRRKNQP